MWRTPTEIRTKQMESFNKCSTCGKAVRNDDKALLCELCDEWEHQTCVRQVDQLSEELYQSIMACTSKNIVYMCTACRNKGSPSKRLLKLEFECARINEQRLASEQLLDERQRTVDSLLRDKQELLREKQVLQDELRSVKRLPMQLSSIHVTEQAQVTGAADVSEIPTLSSDSNSSDTERDEFGSQTSSRRRAPLRRLWLVQPPGFKEIRSRVGKFSGKRGDDDFALWLTDYEEATDDFKWNDETRVKWFSWFIEGPAKATWQRTLSNEERGSWESTKMIYQGQYGVHMDPRTAYLRCHELQYEELRSVQALLEAMREYQRLAPNKLTDTNLESILWNKVPFVLQKEVGEMKEWSLQELFQRNC